MGRSSLATGQRGNIVLGCLDESFYCMRFLRYFSFKDLDERLAVHQLLLQSSIARAAVLHRQSFKGFVLSL